MSFYELTLTREGQGLHIHQIVTGIIVLRHYTSKSNYNLFHLSRGINVCITFSKSNLANIDTNVKDNVNYIWPCISIYYKYITVTTWNWMTNKNLL